MTKITFTLILLSLSLFAGFTDFKIIEEANNAYNASDYNKSIKLFNSLPRKSPKLEYNKGNAYYKAKEYDKALRAYQKAKGVNEQQRLHNIGNTYFQKQKLDEAIKSYQEALKLGEDNDTRNNLELAKKKNKTKTKQEQEKKKQKDQNKNDNKEDKNKTNKKR